MERSGEAIAAASHFPLMRKSTYLLIFILTLAIGSAFYLQSRELYKSRADLVLLQPGQIDIGFSQSMSRHHQQAITMAQLILDGRPTGLQPLARSIVFTQLIELGEMRGWLRLWNQPLFPPSEDMSWMLLSEKPLSDELTQYLIECGRAPGGMPGLASTEDIHKLRQLEGRERDQLFLTLMLAHHEGGIPMARFSANEASLLVVRKLAAQMVLDQAKEIHQMRSILAAYTVQTES